MKLKNAFRVELNNIKQLLGVKHVGKLIQYIEAETSDDAIKLAKNTFTARLHGFETTNAGSMTQKACTLSKVHESLKFGFRGGWFTVHGNGEKTIFEMLKEAEADKTFVRGEITEIDALYVNGKRR